MRGKALKLVVCAAAVACGVFALTGAAVGVGSPSIVISQVYGGGGNTGGVYKNDYVELFNRSDAPVDITNWSIQRSGGDGVFQSATNFKHDLTGAPGTYVIGAGKYFLVWESQGADGTEPTLPAADATGVITVSSTGPASVLIAFSRRRRCRLPRTDALRLARAQIQPRDVSLLRLRVDDVGIIGVHARLKPVAAADDVPIARAHTPAVRARDRSAR